MTEGQEWFLDENPDRTHTLYAPNGVALFNVSLETLEMLGQMFLDQVEDAGEIEDLREALYD